MHMRIMVYSLLLLIAVNVQARENDYDLNARLIEESIDSISNPDASLERRVAEAYWLTHFYTDNGAKGYLYIEPLEKNIDNVLRALNYPGTLRQIVEILGSRYTGSSVAPCYMSIKNQKKIIESLMVKEKEIRSAVNEFRDGARKSFDLPREWTYGQGDIKKAIKNIESCSP